MERIDVFRQPKILDENQLKQFEDHTKKNHIVGDKFHFMFRFSPEDLKKGKKNSLNKKRE